MATRPLSRPAVVVFQDGGTTREECISKARAERDERDERDKRHLVLAAGPRLAREGGIGGSTGVGK